jgi:hypothetical protein
MVHPPNRQKILQNYCSHIRYTSQLFFIHKPNRHEILYNSSACWNQQSTGLRNIYSKCDITCYNGIKLWRQLLCGSHSRYPLPHLKFNEFDISFHNQRTIFGEVCSQNCAQFHVWRQKQISRQNSIHYDVTLNNILVDLGCGKKILQMMYLCELVKYKDILT